MRLRNAVAVAGFAVLAAACATTHRPGLELRSVAPTSSSLPPGAPIGPPVTFHSSRSLPPAPECNKPGVMDQARAIAVLSTHDQAAALTAMWAAPPDVRKCLETPTEEGTDVGSQQVTPGGVGGTIPPGAQRIGP